MEVYNVITQHRTIRKYREYNIPEEHLEMIIKSGIRAPSSTNLQAYCVIRVKDPEIRKKIMALAGNQEHILTASEFLVFVADINRLINCCKELGEEPADPNFLMIYIATIDAAIAAQNMVLTAESLGYGTCYIGAIQNNPCEVAKALDLPKYTYPLFGLTIGVPDEDPELRPRLPPEAMIHIDTYPKDRSNIEKALTAFIDTDFHESFIRRVKRYYSRSGRYRERYEKMKNCLQKMGFKV